MILLPVEQWAEHARQLGHPVTEVRPGRWRHPSEQDPTQAWPAFDPQRPNDLLDLAREVARDRFDWVHAVLLTGEAAARLSVAVQPRRSGVRHPRRPGVFARLLGEPDPRRVPFDRLVNEAARLVGPELVTGVVRGMEIHVVNMPTHLLATTLWGAA